MSNYDPFRGGGHDTGSDLFSLDNTDMNWNCEICGKPCKAGEWLCMNGTSQFGSKISWKVTHQKCK